MSDNVEKLTNRELSEQLESVAVLELRSRPTAKAVLREAAKRLCMKNPGVRQHRRSSTQTKP